MSHKPPCKDCKDRSVGCHGTCEKYKEYRSNLDDRKETIKKNRSTDALIASYVRKASIKQFKKHK